MSRRLLAGAFIALSLLSLTLPRNAAAQRWQGRLYGGWSNADFYGGSKLLGTEARDGFAAGAAAEYIREGEDNIGIELGIAYLEKGAKGTVEPNEMDPEQPPFESTFEGEAKLDYFEINLLFNFYLPIGDKTDIKLGIGPAFGMLTNAKLEGTVDGEPAEADIADYLNGVDFGVVLAAGLVYDLKKVSLLLEGRADFGALAIDNTSQEHDLKTQVSAVVLGVVIPFGQ
jgi:hypothetical protein